MYRVPGSNRKLFRSEIPCKLDLHYKLSPKLVGSKRISKPEKPKANLRKITAALLQEFGFRDYKYWED